MLLFCSQIGHQYKAQPEGSLGFGPDYIGKLYNLSDDAIRHGERIEAYAGASTYKSTWQCKADLTTIQT